MLSTLRIKNLALVEDLTWELQPGLNIITGETGAGKSILIGALNLGVSFYFAFRLALQAHNVSGVDRARIRTAIWARWRSHPRSFFVPE